MVARSASRTGFTPVDPPRIAVAADGTIATIAEASRVTLLQLPSGAAFAEIGVDPEAVSSQVAWLGTPPRLLVLSRYDAYSTAHLLDPYGPRTIAEIRLEGQVRLYATVGVTALILGAHGAAVLVASETHLVAYQFPTRASPLAAGAAAAQFVVGLTGSIEEWDPQSRMPKRRLRLPRSAVITGVGGSERVVWMTTQQEPARIDVIPVVNRGQPKAHDLPEAIAATASHPRSDLVACIGAESGRLYVIDLDGRARTRMVTPDGIDHIESAALVIGRMTGVIVAQAGRPVEIVPLDGREPVRESSRTAIAVPSDDVPSGDAPSRGAPADTAWRSASFSDASIRIADDEAGEGAGSLGGRAVGARADGDANADGGEVAEPALPAAMISSPFAPVAGAAERAFADEARAVPRSVRREDTEPAAPRSLRRDEEPTDGRSLRREEEAADSSSQRTEEPGPPSALRSSLFDPEPEADASVHEPISALSPAMMTPSHAPSPRAATPSHAPSPRAATPPPEPLPRSATPPPEPLPRAVAAPQSEPLPRAVAAPPPEPLPRAAAVAAPSLLEPLPRAASAAPPPRPGTPAPRAATPLQRPLPASGARGSSSVSERFSAWRDLVRQDRAQGEPVGGLPGDAPPAAASPAAPAVAPAAASPADPPAVPFAGAAAPAVAAVMARVAMPAVAAAPATPADPRASWRDEVVAWYAATLSGAVDLGAPSAPQIEVLLTRFDLAPALLPALTLLYGAHLCGQRGAAPVEVARALDRQWDEALGRGELAARGVAHYAGSRVTLAPVVLRVLDELPPLTGALIGEPGAIPLLGACVVIAPGDEPIAAIAERSLPRIGGAILAASGDPDRAALLFEARAYGAAPMLRAVLDAPPRDAAIFVIDDTELADRLGLPRLG
jgi:hypothetical protein